MRRPFLVSQYYRRRTQCGLGFRLTDNYKLYINVLFDTYITQVIEVCHKKKLHYLVCIFNYAMGFAVHTYINILSWFFMLYNTTYNMDRQWRLDRSIPFLFWSIWEEMLESVSDFVFSKHYGYRSSGLRGVKRSEKLW